MQEAFHAITDHLATLVRGDEVFTASFHSESSDFVRFNRGAIRQAGAVTQHELSLDWIRGRRHASAHLTLSGDPELDRARLKARVDELRALCDELPDDPHLLYATEVRSSERELPDRLPMPEDACATVLDAAGDRDLVGILASGPIAAGFANSLGQRNWFASHSFNLDWSLHQSAAASDKAVKDTYAGADWSAEELLRRVELASEELEVLARPPRRIEPGRYRAHLSPAALYEIMSMLAWGGFGLRAHRTRTTPLLRLAEGEVQLDAGIDLVENTADGIAPDFQDKGFIRPERVPLVRGGRFADCLVSPRSSVEYAVPTNGANGSESPQSLDLASGRLARDRVLEELGTGIHVGNLWYLNYSDRKACRTTGMTRFATFWVEGGRISAPLDVMRFDESVYRMLGENLVGLTRERDLILDPDTYGRRSTRSARLPGAVVDGLRLTL